jgi:hypothetical protein
MIHEAPSPTSSALLDRRAQQNWRARRDLNPQQSVS